MTRHRITLIVLVLIVGIAVAGTLVFSHNRVVNQASTLVLDVNTRALAQWDPEALVAHAHNSLTANTKPDFIPNYFRALSFLGALQEIRDINYELTLSPFWTWYDSGNAYYTMNASFANGFAEIRITLIRESGQWLISEYLVLTPAMAA